MHFLDDLEEPLKAGWVYLLRGRSFVGTLRRNNVDIKFDLVWGFCIPENKPYYADKDFKHQGWHTISYFYRGELVLCETDYDRWLSDGKYARKYVSSFDLIHRLCTVDEMFRLKLRAPTDLHVLLEGKRSLEVLFESG